MRPIHRIAGLSAIAASLAVLLGAGCGNDAPSATGAAPAPGGGPTVASVGPTGPRGGMALDPDEVDTLDDIADVGTCTSVTLSPSLTSPQTTGPSVVFTASASCGKSTAEYRFYLETRGGGFVLQQAYSTTNAWTWQTAGLLPGHYVVRVNVRARGAKGSQAHAQVHYDLDCVPTTCAAIGAECGPAPDGCGDILNCGNCAYGYTCLAGAPPLHGGRCDVDYYDPSYYYTCEEVGVECGWIYNGGGGIQYCGSCKAPETCGGGGVADQCGTGFTGCIPYTCEDLGVECGTWDDGCGGPLDCGNGWDGDPEDGCAENGTPGVIGASPKPCVPITCEQYGFDCGVVGDGCEYEIKCGGKNGYCRDSEKTCGWGGRPFVCGKDKPDGGCVPYTCEFYGATCGNATDGWAWYDGCGGVLDCGECPSGTYCTGDGTPGQCGIGTPCVPLTCAYFGFDCGTAPDGCGGTLECGACKSPKTCGGGSPGRGNRCGE